MRDLDIRRRLYSTVLRAHANDSSTRVVEELGMCLGEVRIDVAVINGELSGFEIKSAHDTLNRLAHQAEIYSRVFDRVTIVTAERHVIKVEAMIPRWWGVMISPNQSNSEFQTIRASDFNVGHDPYAIASLLWRDEALQLLTNHGLDRGKRSRPKPELWRILADQLSPAELRNEVRQRLKQRTNWRAP